MRGRRIVGMFARDRRAGLRASRMALYASRPFRLLSALTVGTVLYYGVYEMTTGSTLRANQVCQSNLRRLGQGLLLYVQDYDGFLPPAQRWSPLALAVSGNPRGFHCPAARAPFSYAVNRFAVGARLANGPAETVMVMESDAYTAAATGGPGSWPHVPRHFGGDNVCLEDGHVAFANAFTKARLRWGRRTVARMPGAYRATCRLGRRVLDEYYHTAALHIASAQLAVAGPEPRMHGFVRPFCGQQVGSRRRSQSRTREGGPDAADNWRRAQPVTGN